MNEDDEVDDSNSMLFVYCFIIYVEFVIADKNKLFINPTV